MVAKYPHNSPYAFAENRLIDGIELEGLEWADLQDFGNDPSNVDRYRDPTTGVYTLPTTLDDGTNITATELRFENNKWSFYVGEDLFYTTNGWSRDGTESELMTHWDVWPTNDNFDPSTDQYFGWVAPNRNPVTNAVIPGTGRECGEATRLQLGEDGITGINWNLFNGDWINDNSANDATPGYVENTARQQRIAISYINRELKAGRGVAIGYDSHPGRSYPGNSHGTDHFVYVRGGSIVGGVKVWNFIENGYARVIDPATGNYRALDLGNVIMPYSNFRMSSVLYGKHGQRMTWYLRNP